MARPIRGINCSQTHVDIAPIDHAFNSLRNLGVLSTTDLHATSPRSLFDPENQSSFIGASDWELDILSAASISYAKLINDSKLGSLHKGSSLDPFLSTPNAQSSSSLYSTDSSTSLGLEPLEKMSPPSPTLQDAYLDPAFHSLDSRTLASRRASTFSKTNRSFASNNPSDTCTAPTANSTWEHDIISASSLGLVRLVTDLLSRGADASACNEQGWTPAMHAANMGHFSVLKLLVNHGAAVNVQEPVDGKTALMLAASNGHTRCVEILISAGADRTIVDRHGYNAAHYAVANGHGNNHLMSKYLQLNRSRPRYVKPSSHQSGLRRIYRH